MKKKLFKFAAGALSVGAAVCALASCGSSSDTVKLGLIANLSGSASFYGQQVKHGAELAVKDINANGGIDGKTVELVVKNDAQDTTTAVQQYNALVDEGVVGIVGAVISGTTEAVAEQAAKDNFPMITPSGSAASITENRNSVFRACFTDPDQGLTLAKLCKDLKTKANDDEYKVVLFKDSTQNYSTGIAQTFQEAVNDTTYGVTIVDTIEYAGLDKLQTNLDTFYTRVCGYEGVDAVVFPDYTNADYQVVNKFRSGTKYNDVTFIGGDGWDGTEAVDGADATKLYNCYYSTNLYMAADVPSVVKFVTDFKADYPEEETVSQFAALAYDAVYMYKGALEACKSTDKEKVIAAIKALEFDGLTGKGTFNDQGNPVKTASIVTWDVEGKLSYYGAI